MDHEKTGALIAKRRNELSLTQKALAQKLNISDRAVSKWERGAGFPDISLIEPLADALGLTVLELLHGQEEPPAPEEERSARETLNNIRPEVHEKMKKTRRWIAVLAVCAAVLAAALAVLLGLAGTAKGDWHMEDCTAAEATAASEYALITPNEFALMEALWQDEKILTAMTEYAEYPMQFDKSGSPISIEMDKEFCGDYFRKFILPVRNLDFYNIYVRNGSVSVQYGTELINCDLEIENDGTVHKTVNEFEVPWRTEDGQIIDDASVRSSVESFDNDQFRRSVCETGLAALLN